MVQIHSPRPFYLPLSYRLRPGFEEHSTSYSTRNQPTHPSGIKNLETGRLRSYASANVRQRVARAEYLAASDPAKRIPERRVADIWNEYVQSIGAPEEALVTAVEIHNMRDGAYAVSQHLWTHWHNQTVWSMPNIFAVDANGKIAEGCRAVEALRIIHDLDMMFDNLRSARKRIREGIVLSEETKKRRSRKQCHSERHCSCCGPSE
jgi:hypothetical protein